MNGTHMLFNDCDLLTDKCLMVKSVVYKSFVKSRRAFS